MERPRNKFKCYTLDAAARTAEGGIAMTNYQKIRAEINSMTAKQFVKFCDCKGGRLNAICKFIDGCPHFHTDVSCNKCIKEWLESEVKENAG